MQFSERYAKRRDSSTENVSIAPSDISSEFDANRKNIKYGKSKEAAWAMFSEYCQFSSINGIQYLGEPKRSWQERLFWFLICTVSISTCSVLTVDMWNKWNSNPVIVNFAEKATPIWEIPFPAVTICPITKYKSSIFNYTHVFEKMFREWYNEEQEELKLSPDELEYVEAILQTCESYLARNLTFGHNFTTFDEIVQRIENASVNFDDTFSGCEWRGQSRNCEDIFVKTITEEGICYTFNSLKDSEIFRLENLSPNEKFGGKDRRESSWTLEGGFAKNAGKYPYPERVVAAGDREGLIVYLIGEVRNFDRVCKGAVQGFKILLHTPGEVSQVSRQYFRVPHIFFQFKQEVMAAITPVVMSTSDGLENYHPKTRQCYYNNEKKLRFFQQYTQANCQLECLTNYTYDLCECVKFSMPKIPGAPICGAAKIKCYDDAADKLLIDEFLHGLDASSGNENEVTVNCDCLPACTSILYTVELFPANLESAGKFPAYDKNDTDREVAYFSIFFKENEFWKSKRTELYGKIDFIADCGGLFGLFMGVSILSIVEILYFCTIRLGMNLKMRRKEMDKIREKKILEKTNLKLRNDFTSITIRDETF